MIKRELPIFLVVGCLTVALDFLTYRGLLWVRLLDVGSAKAAGFLMGTLFAYFANRFWTFSHKTHAAGSAWRFILVYSLSLAINVFVNSALIANLSGTLLPLWNEFNAFITTKSFVSTYQPIFGKIIEIVDKIVKQEAVIQIAFLAATLASATFNFIGMKLFVFKSSPALSKL